MIQLNLLPDVKSKYIKIQRTKRMALLSAFSVSALAVLIVIIFVGIIYGTQKVTLGSLNKSIKTYSDKIKATPGLNKILTIQNQLNSLTALHDQKPVVSRLFTYLPQITPSGISISNISFNLSENTLSITGDAPSLISINKFVDTLKFTDYKTSSDSESAKAFSSVVLSSFSKSDKAASYNISATFQPDIFDSSFSAVSLIVPQITSTRSVTEQPDTLFKESVNPEVQEP
jgi:hypothetical protein